MCKLRYILGESVASPRIEYTACPYANPCNTFELANAESVTSIEQYCNVKCMLLETFHFQQFQPEKT